MINLELRYSCFSEVNHSSPDHPSLAIVIKISVNVCDWAANWGGGGGGNFVHVTRMHLSFEPNCGSCLDTLPNF